MSWSKPLKLCIALLCLILHSCKKNPPTKTPDIPIQKEDIQDSTEEFEDNDKQPPAESTANEKNSSSEEATFNIPLIDSFYPNSQEKDVYDLLPKKLIPSDTENLYVTGIRLQKNLTKPIEEVFLIKFNLHSKWDSNGIFIPSNLNNPSKNNGDFSSDPVEILGGMKYRSGKILILTNQKSKTKKNNSEEKFMKTYIFGANDSGLLRTRDYNNLQEIFLTAASSSVNQEFMILAGKSNSKTLNSFLGLIDEEGNISSYYESPEKNEDITLIHSISNDHFVTVVQFQKTWILRSYRIHSITKDIIPISELEIITPMDSHIARAIPSSIDHNQNTLAVSMEMYFPNYPSNAPSIYLFQTEIYPNGILSQNFKQIFQDTWNTHPYTSFISMQSEKISVHRSRENYSSLGHTVQISSVFFSTKDFSSPYSGLLWELSRFEEQSSSTNFKEALINQKRILKSVYWPGKGLHEKYLWFLSENQYAEKNLDKAKIRSSIHLGTFAIP